MTAPVQVGPPPQGGGPVRSSGKSAPTLEQLLILVARAERKGGLDHVEGRRLRDGILRLADNRPAEQAQAELLRKYKNARHRAWKWQRRATGIGAGPGGLVDSRAEDSVRRVTDLATRWTHIPAKRAAGISVLAALSGRQS